MSDPVDEPKVRRSGRGLRIALFLSLGLNLLIFGLIGGVFWGVAGPGRGGGDGPPALRAMGLGEVAFMLDREGREELRSRVEGRRGELTPLGAGLGRSVLQFARVLQEEDFDRDAAARALAAQRDSRVALQAEGHDLLLDQLEAMSAAERQDLAERLLRGLRRFHNRGEGHGPRNAGE